MFSSHVYARIKYNLGRVVRHKKCIERERDGRCRIDTAKGTNTRSHRHLNKLGPHFFTNHVYCANKSTMPSYYRRTILSFSPSSICFYYKYEPCDKPFQVPLHSLQISFYWLSLPANITTFSAFIRFRGMERQIFVCMSESLFLLHQSSTE